MTFTSTVKLAFARKCMFNLSSSDTPGNWPLHIHFTKLNRMLERDFGPHLWKQQIVALELERPCGVMWFEREFYSWGNGLKRRSRVAKVMTNKLAVSVFQFPTGALPTTETGKAKVRLGPNAAISALGRWREEKPLVWEGSLGYRTRSWHKPKQLKSNAF